MRKLIKSATIALFAIGLVGSIQAETKNALTPEEKAAGFTLMFDGSSLSGWKMNENPESATVKDGNIVTKGNRGHLYYVADGKNNQFQDLELRAKVKIHPSSNSGIYIQIAWHDKGWPLAQGYEAQVCSNDYRDPKKTGSVYGFLNLGKSDMPDGEWFDYTVTIKGRTVTTMLNGKVAASFTEPADRATRLKGGYIALQCHDPKSTVEYHTLRIRRLTGDNNNAPENKPGYDKSKDVGTAAPAGADVPFDGTMESVKANWKMWPKADMPITWQLMDNPTGGDKKVLMTNGGKKWGTHDLVTNKKYGDFEAHVEFVMMGKRGDDSAEGYTNSGVYLQNRYEMQIESPKGKNVKDPYNWKIGPHGIGAFCMDRVPDQNAWRPNGQWHAYHVIFTAAKYDGDKQLEPARATVWWNGLKIHDNAVIKKANGGVKVGPSKEGLKLQEHGQDVRYQNVWIRER